MLLSPQTPKGAMSVFGALSNTDLTGFHQPVRSKILIERCQPQTPKGAMNVLSNHFAVLSLIVPPDGGFGAKKNLWKY